MSFLEVRGLTKRFDAVDALSSVDLEVGDGELVVVLGATGAGKTTLLRSIAGLETPDAGTITMAGRDVTHATPAERDVALVFQNFSLYPRWTVRRNLEFPLRAPGRNTSEQEIAERVKWAGELLRITHLLDRDSRRLSGGEMQRVAIGRAIVRRPKLFLMDEPLTNLDAKLRESLRVEIVRLARELGAPMVYVTHDQAEALSMAERIVVLSEGRVLQTGTPHDVYFEPANPDVARQLGQPPINVLEVTRDGEHWRTSDGTSVASVGAVRTVQGDRVDADRALLGIRPEHVTLEGGDSDATVAVVENTGPARIVVLQWAGAEVHVLVPYDERVGGAALALEVGDTVRPRVHAERAMLWSAS